eukprot:TRINITY_DN5176_c0_g1_i2.p1 TRINITY_DN5176_c0_g1~~TRINITY_DN5176_c0_g1_i2.p1  ORF type:complete len:290 (-),score=52.11 TRINITY_DN5176_c0_g1_i2:54-923(-)
MCIRDSINAEYMGGKQSIEKRIHRAINAANLEALQLLISEFPDKVNTKIADGKTNPLSRASFMGNLSIVAYLVQKGASLDLPTINGNTALMWAAFVGSQEVTQFLVLQGADVNHANNEGLTAVDLAISRMHYMPALYLYQNGAKLKSIEEYRSIQRAIFDLDKFMTFLLEKKEVSEVSCFYIQKKIGKDLVVDPRESWGQFFKRVYNFDHAPMIERSELPTEKQPHKSVWGKFSCYINGVNPYPPKPLALEEIKSNVTQEENMYEKEEKIEKESSEVKVDLIEVEMPKE